MNDQELIAGLRRKHLAPPVGGSNIFTLAADALEAANREIDGYKTGHFYTDRGRYTFAELVAIIDEHEPLDAVIADAKADQRREDADAVEVLLSDPNIYTGAAVTGVIAALAELRKGSE